MDLDELDAMLIELTNDPPAVLDVDGVVSRRTCEDWHRGAMIALLPAEHAQPSEWFRARWDAPPCETELSAWVAGERDW